MKRAILIPIVIMSTLLTFSLQAKIIPASSSLIEYTGRIDFSNPDAPRFSYSGVSIRACFKGTGISMILDDEQGENYFNIIIDRIPVSRIKAIKGKQQYILAKNLENKIHEVEIFRGTELTFGKTGFLGFELDKDESLVEITNKRSRLIEFIGNSITCGYGNESELGANFSAVGENHYLTYAAVTSRSFNARHLAVCRSGIGIYRNYDGPLTGSPECMPNFYKRIFLYDENPKYTFREKPDLICIDLGSNDFSNNAGDSARFVSSYINFIDSLQHYYNKPEILCLLGPMMNGPMLEKVRKYIQYVVTFTNNRSKGKVHFFEMSEQKGDLGIGADYHPTVDQHLKNGQELTNYISTLKEWEITPILLKTTVEIPNTLSLTFNAGVDNLSNSFSGFKVTIDGKSALISNIYKDKSNGAKLLIILEEFVKPGQKVELSYQKGQISGKGNVLLESFDNLVVKNKLKSQLR